MRCHDRKFQQRHYEAATLGTPVINIGITTKFRACEIAMSPTSPDKSSLRTAISAVPTANGRFCSQPIAMVTDIQHSELLSIGVYRPCLKALLLKVTHIDGPMMHEELLLVGERRRRTKSLCDAVPVTTNAVRYIVTDDDEAHEQGQTLIRQFVSSTPINEAIRSIATALSCCNRHQCHWCRSHTNLAEKGLANPYIVLHTADICRNRHYRHRAFLAASCTYRPDAMSRNWLSIIELRDAIARHHNGSVSQHLRI